MTRFEELDELLEQLEEVGDVTICDFGSKVYITIEDSEGFDEDDFEIEREYARPDLVEELETIIDEFATGNYPYIITGSNDYIYKFIYASSDIDGLAF